MVAGINKMMPTHTGAASVRDALTPDTGWTFWNTDTDVYEVYDGSDWQVVSGSNGVDLSTVANIGFTVDTDELGDLDFIHGLGAIPTDGQLFYGPEDQVNGSYGGAGGFFISGDGTDFANGSFGHDINISSRFEVNPSRCLVVGGGGGVSSFSLRVGGVSSTELTLSTQVFNSPSVVTLEVALILRSNGV